MPDAHACSGNHRFNFKASGASDRQITGIAKCQPECAWADESFTAARTVLYSERVKRYPHSGSIAFVCQWLCASNLLNYVGVSISLSSSIANFNLKVHS